MKASWPLSWLACLGIGAVLAPPMDAPPEPVVPSTDGWQQPELPRKRDQAGQALALVGSPMFEPEARSALVGTGAAALVEDPRWRIAGIVARGTQGTVFVRFSAPSREAQSLHVGDRLPSGHRIYQIEPNAVCVQVGKKILRIGVQSSD